MTIAVATAIFIATAMPVQAREAIHKGDVVVVPMRGEVAPSLLAFLRRAVKTAENNEASAILFDMNTYGGRLDTATDIVNALNQTKIPTYTFINTNAGSAGSLIAIATRHIYMAPVSAIGAAAPILPTGEDLPNTAKEKTISYWSALVRGSATRNGHNPDVAEAFMNKDKEVKIGDRVVHPKGAVLTLNAQEATERINGKPLLAEGVADSVPDLTKKAGLKGNIAMIEPSGFEQIAFWITALAPLLLLGGILGAYLEFKIPGVIWPGIISAICFGLFFLGHYVAGLAGWEVVHEYLSPVRFDGFQSTWSIARGRATTVRDCDCFNSRNARHRRYCLATERQSPFRRSRRRCSNGRRIHRLANSSHRCPNRWNAGRGEERGSNLTKNRFN